MIRILNPGKVPLFTNVLSSVFVKVERRDDGQLSIIGVIGPKKNGDCLGSCGQIVDELSEITEFSEEWDVSKVARLAELWNRWHLNNMRPGCPHQRDWPTTEPLEVMEYTTSGTKTPDVAVLIRMNRATELEIERHAQAESVYHKFTVGSSDPYPEARLKLLLDEGYLAPWKTKSKTAGWVYPYQHPKGLLAKPCPVCGYKYGTAWLKEVVPQEVIDELFSMPASTTTPAWV